MNPRSPLFCVGLLLGGGATWFFLNPAPSAETNDQPSSPVPVSLPPWSWRESATPPLLARNSASVAVSAWLALRGPDGGAPDYATRVASLRALLLHLPPEGFPQLVEALSRSAHDDDVRLRALAFTTWASRDASSAARWAIVRGPDYHNLAREAVWAWAALDADAAAAWACALPDDKSALAVSYWALAALAAKNPARALELARSRDDAFRNQVLGYILQVLGQTDPGGTVHTFAPELWNAGKGFSALREVLRTWAKKDPSAAIAWLIAQPRRSDSELSNWLRSLGNGSSAWRRTTADAVIAAPGITSRASILRDLLFSWGNSEPADAAAWLNGLADPDLRLNLLERTSHGYLSDNPEKSLPLALVMPEGANRTQRLSQLLGAWAKINPDAVMAWLHEHQSESGVATASHAVHSALLAEIARDDPKAALVEWQALSDPRARLIAIDSIAKAWGQKDPAAALQWADKARETAGNTIYGGNGELLFRWSQTNPKLALRWLEDWIARQPEDIRGHVSSHYLDALGGTESEKAPRGSTADLYTKIKDPALRTETLTRHVREWLTKDPVGARAWLESHDALNPAEAAALLTAAK